MTQISKQERFVGIDVAKHHLDVHLLPDGKRWRMDYSPAGLVRLLDQLGQAAPALIAMEKQRSDPGCALRWARRTAAAVLTPKRRVTARRDPPSAIARQPGHEDQTNVCHP